MPPVSRRPPLRAIPIADIHSSFRLLAVVAVEPERTVDSMPTGARLRAPDRQERVMSSVLLDAAGRRRSPATMPGFHSGRPPRNKGRRYPADPPTVEEIVAVRRQAGTTPHGLRMRGLIVVLRRAGLRIHEALALTEADLDARRGAVLVRRGKGGRRREVGMDEWAWEESSSGRTSASRCPSARCFAS
jgi:integrase